MRLLVSTNKPKFDPSAPFEEAKPKFDPNAPFEQARALKNEAKQTEYSPIDTAMEHGFNSAAMGYAPQAAGAVSRVTDPLARMLQSSVIDPKTGQPIPAEQMQPQRSYTQARDEELDKLVQMAQQNPGSALTGQIIGGAASMALPMRAMAPAASAVGRIAQGAGIGAAQGALYNPGDVKGQMSGAQLPERAQGAAIGGAIGGLGSSVAEGSSKLSDYLMQKAVGMKKYIPGVGNTLASEGLWGTKNGILGVGDMTGQATQGISEAENKLQTAVKGLTGSVKADPIAEAIQGKASRYMPPDGVIVPSENEPYIAEAMGRAREAINRGDLSPQDALATARSVAAPAYNRGEPKQAFTQQLSQTEAGSLKSGLKGLAEDQGVPDVSEALNSEAALIKAKKALTQPENLSSVLSKSLLKAGLGGSAGYMVGGPVGAAAGAALSTPLGLSLGGQAARAGAVANPAAQVTLRQALEKKRNQ